MIRLRQIDTLGSGYIFHVLLQSRDLFVYIRECMLPSVRNLILCVRIKIGIY